MNSSTRSLHRGVLALMAGAGILVALTPAESKAQTGVTKTGSNALAHDTSGTYNTADGFQALETSTSGAFNTAVGANALFDNLTGSDNTATGLGALFTNKGGNNNTADGYWALHSNISGINNVAEGFEALFANTTGTDNVATGYQALYSCTNDSEETATGFQALYHDTTGGDFGLPNQNVADGFQALLNNTLGYVNTAVGAQALLSNQGGVYNTAVGGQALMDTTAGSFNVAVGNDALGLDTGSFNIGIGEGAGYFITTGSNNIVIAYNNNGFTPGANGNNNIDIGTQGVAGDNNITRIGSVQTATYISGVIYGNGSGLTGITGNLMGTIGIKGSLQVDESGSNVGTLTNALTFGGSTGEGIASDRNGSNPSPFDLEFYTDYANRMEILQNGNVGIGTTAPQSELSVVRANAGGRGGEVSIVNNAAATVGNEAALNFGTDPSTYNGNSGNAQVKAISTNVDNRTDLVFSDWNGSSFGERMRIKSEGNVGIGTSTPSQKLDVNGEYMQVDGLGGVLCYFGDDGSGNDVQIGSLKSGITNVARYNATDQVYMRMICSSVQINGGADLAEPFPVTRSKQPVVAGDVVVIDDANPGQVTLTDRPYDARVVGVISGANGIHPGIQMQQQDLLAGGKNVALTGRVYVQADTSNGPIRPGDLLTTSSTPGRAMKVTDHGRADGAVLGKAMTSLDEGQGMVLMVVTLR